jgi:hypothetical protein
MKFNPEAPYVDQQVVEFKQPIYRKEPAKNSWNNIVDYINYAPNWRHPDGRIYASAAGEDYKVAEVSPYNPKFETQIELGVWPLVSALTSKGYLTCSSCEGHGWDLNCRVTLVLPTLEAAIILSESLNIAPWKIQIETVRPIHDNQPSFGTTRNMFSREELKLKVFPYYNKIFCRNYEEYFFIDMFLPKYCGKWFLWNWITKTKSKKYEIAMQQMVEKILTELPHSIY